MVRIAEGAAVVALSIENNGLAHAAASGLLMPLTSTSLSNRTVAAAVAWGATAVVADLRSATLAVDKVLTYPVSLPPLPAALVVTPAQFWLYADMGRAAAKHGIMRRAFLCPIQAAEWALLEARVCQEARAWLEAQRLLREAQAESAGQAYLATLRMRPRVATVAP